MTTSGEAATASPVPSQSYAIDGVVGAGGRQKQDFCTIVPTAFTRACSSAEPASRRDRQTTFETSTGGTPCRAFHIKT